jgi:hypothetical protein
MPGCCEVVVPPLHGPLASHLSAGLWVLCACTAAMWVARQCSGSPCADPRGLCGGVCVPPRGAHDQLDSATLPVPRALVPLCPHIHFGAPRCSCWLARAVLGRGCRSFHVLAAVVSLFFPAGFLARPGGRRLGFPPCHRRCVACGKFLSTCLRVAFGALSSRGSRACLRARVGCFSGLAPP